MKNTTLTRKSGFSLIELLVVITIIAVLAGVGAVGLSGASKNARDNRRISDLETVRQASVLRKSQNGTYLNIGSPISTTRYTTLVTSLASAGHLSNPVPVDPKNSGSYMYSATGTATTFCICAKMEEPLNGNSESQSCTTLLTAGTADTDYYCVQQP